MSRYREQYCVNPACNNSMKMPKNSLCYHCSTKLANYDKLEAKVEKLEDRTSNNYIHHSGDGFLGRFRAVDKECEEYIQFTEKFLQLLKDLSINHYEGNHGTCTNLEETIRYGRKNGTVLELSIEPHNLTRFQYSIVKLINRGYANGVEYGRNLLVQLNNGEITPMQLDGKVEDANRT